MFTHELKLRVRYAETDRMGYVYYGNYAAYFEVARVEMLRSLGFTYKRMEDDGIILPVLDYTIKYIRPAYYDDLLIIKTVIKNPPAARIRFDHETFNEQNVLLNVATITLVFINRHTLKPIPAREDFMRVIRKYF